MTEDELKQFLEENKADIQASVKAKVIDQILASHQWHISSQISAVVDEFVKDEIVPEVKKHLAGQKGPILEAAIVGANEIGNTLAKALVEHTAKNLVSDSYKFRSVMQALFDR